jgi:hypothetical protein
MSLIIKKNTTFKIPRTGSGAPSGIPYSTLQIILSGFNDTRIGVDRTSPITLTKRTAFGFPNEWGSSGDEGYYVYVYRSNSSGTWGVLLQQFGEDGFGSYVSATNPSTSNSEIPTTGWVLSEGVTGSIIITAA